MRELLFKNITSLEKGRKILSLTEEFSQNGIFSHVQRRFIFQVKETSNIRKRINPPQFYIFRQQDTAKKEEEIFIKIKGNLYTVNDDKFFKIAFCHSLKINICPSKKSQK